VHEVAPRIYLLAETIIGDESVSRWLEDLNGTACIGHVTGSSSEQLIEYAARRCYKSFDVGLNPNVTRIRTSSKDYHENILKSRHGSVLEHASSTWALERVSRVFTHELVRHRQGTAFSQESLRYVRLTDFGFMIPEEIASNTAAVALFKQVIADAEEAQRKLVALFDVDALPFDQKKVLTSAFRRIAPDGLATGIVFTANMRALRWLIEHRTSRHAEQEIRKVFHKIAQIAMGKWPYLFQDFTNKYVHDGVPEWVPTYSKV
jgi:thymidylate synthase (FAD)